MAFYFSRRKVKVREKDDSTELNLVPYLDILMNLIIFMLMSITGLAVFGTLNVNVPAYASEADTAEKQEDSKPDYLLTVAISEKGFFVAASGGVLGQVGEAGEIIQGEPTIPRLQDGNYNYPDLTRKMVQIKGTPEFKDETKVRIVADASIQYEVLVGTMDAIREIPGHRSDLFPDVNLSSF